MAARMPGESNGGVDCEAERRPARNVQRKVSAHVDAGQAGDRYYGGSDSAPGRAQTREDSRAQGNRHTRVPGQIPEPGSIATAAVGTADPVSLAGAAAPSV